MKQSAFNPPFTLHSMAFLAPFDLPLRMNPQPNPSSLDASSSIVIFGTLTANYHRNHYHRHSQPSLDEGLSSRRKTDGHFFGQKRGSQRARDGQKRIKSYLLETLCGSLSYSPNLGRLFALSYKNVVQNEILSSPEEVRRK